MENICSIISVKCTKGYTGQLEGSNVSKTLGHCCSSVMSIYKCYGDSDFVILLKPLQQSEAIKMVDECTMLLRSQPWVTTTTTSFGKECFTSKSAKEHA